MSFDDVPRSHQQTKEAPVMHSPDNDVPLSQQTNSATIMSPDNDKEEYADCTYD